MARTSQSNPAVSAVQYRLAQAVLSGTARGGSSMSKKAAQEIVDRTPAKLRSEWSRKPNAKRKSGPITTATRSFSRIGSVLTQPVSKAGEYVDRQVGKLIGYNPKAISQMSAYEINKAMEKVDRESSKITDEFIKAGRGNERPSEYLKLSDPLSRKALANYQRHMALVVEIERRAGPGMRTLPRGFGPIKTNPKRNPESDAQEMFRAFHGRASEEIAEYIEEEHYHGNLAELGQLIELKVETVTGLDCTFNFEYEGKPEKGVILASNESGTSLYFVGGDQAIDLDEIEMNDEEHLKDSMVIGQAYFVSYFTEKDFDDFQPTIYEHELGEETEELPTLRYDRLNKRLYLDGGAYIIKKPMFRTSDGIEN